jgi:hypothetical protein
MAKVTTYLTNGLVFDYEVASHASGREHADQIIKNGYRSVQDGVMTAWPVHMIFKVKVTEAGTMYPDTVRGT